MEYFNKSGKIISGEELYKDIYKKYSNEPLKKSVFLFNKSNDINWFKINYELRQIIRRIINDLKMIYKYQSKRSIIFNDINNYNEEVFECIKSIFENEISDKKKGFTKSDFIEIYDFYLSLVDIEKFKIVNDKLIIL